MSRVKLSRWSGYVKGDALLDWLKDGNVQDFIQNACGLIEYVHRFKLACKDELKAELDKDEIKDYCLLRARIFWDNGQIFFRRIEPDNFQFLLISEGNNVPSLNGLDLQSQDREFEFRDRGFILWGTYDGKINGYREERVSGYSVIDYPSEIGNKEYPLLRIREYIDETGDVVVWRFLGLTSADKDDIEKAFKEVLDEKG